MKEFICTFLTQLKSSEIKNLFQGIIKNPIEGNLYPLICNSESLQIYFVDVCGLTLTLKEGYISIGNFTTQEIQNPTLLQDKINELKQKWCQ